MDDKELADKVVALGVGNHQHLDEGRDKGDWYGYDCTGDTAAYFVRDWRVAGALIEKLPASYEVQTLTLKSGHVSVVVESEDCTIFGPFVDECFPRAIIEACVEALASEEE